MMISPTMIYTYESKIEFTFNSVGKYYIVVGRYPIDFSNNFGIDPKSSTHDNTGQLNSWKTQNH